MISVASVQAVTISPPSPVAGQGFVVTFTGNPEKYEAVGVFLGSSCTGTAIFSTSIFSEILTESIGGQPAGQYSALDANGCVNFTVTPAIPEYPYGLALLLIFTTLGYMIVRRKTLNQKTTP